MTKADFIELYCENDKQHYTVERGTTLWELKEKICPNDRNIIGALVNNTTQDLSYSIYNPKSIHFIDRSSSDGMSIYKRSLIFLLYTAVKQCFPQQKMKVEYSISNGTFCRIDDSSTQVDQTSIETLKAKMNALIEQDLPFTKKDTLTTEAVEQFKATGLDDKIDLLLTRGKMYTSVYQLDGVINYFYGTLAPSTSFLDCFDIISYNDGILLSHPSQCTTSHLLPFIDQAKLFKIYQQHKKWASILQVQNIGDLNRVVEQHHASDVIKIGEALHEKRISQIADQILSRKDQVKLVMIAGPSSSGKTTFGKRLSVQLMVNGIRPVILSLDNYFKNRVDTPKHENGEYNFEAFDALDTELFTKDINALMAGEEIEIPKFSFATGERYYDGERLQLAKNNVIVVEGIHGLNPKLCDHLPYGSTYKIFVSALTTISIDDHNLISPTDNRLIRRMVRDAKYRGYSALDTIKRWDSVLEGELINIIPYQEEADEMFNSALIYELAVLKQQAVPLLSQVLESYPQHSKAQKLLKFFSYFTTIPMVEIPPTSILREFLGGSSFRY